MLSFLFSNKNICCGCSLEASHRDASNEPHNKYFHRDIRQILTFFAPKKVTYPIRLCFCTELLLKSEQSKSMKRYLIPNVSIKKKISHQQTKCCDLLRFLHDNNVNVDLKYIIYHTQPKKHTISFS